MLMAGDFSSADFTNSQVTYLNQGCQIFLGAANQNGGKCTKIASKISENSKKLP
jgi:hypothetical protein